MLHIIFRRSRVLGVITVVIVLLALIAGLFASRRVEAQPAMSFTFYYVRDAGDTLGTETVSQAATSITGVMSMKGQPRIEWTQALASGTPSILTLRLFAPGAAAGAEPLQSGTIEVRGDSAYIDLGTATQRNKQTLAAKAGALPLVNSSVLHAALLASYARLKSRASIDVFLTAGAQTLPAGVTQVGDTTVFKLATSEMRIVSGPDGIPTLIRLPGQGTSVVRGGSDAKVGAPKINYDAPAGAPYTAEHVKIPTGRGYDLAATLTRPTRSGKVPVVITISGSGPQDRDSRISLVEGYAMFRQVADTLGRRGIAVLRYDDRGVGESGGRETAAKATSADLADDARSVIAWLRTRPDIDGTRIALAGHSEGGMIAPMIAASDPQVKGIALLAGQAYTGLRVSLYQNRQAVDGVPTLTAKQRDSIMATVPTSLDSAGKAIPWLGFWLKHDPVAVARTVKQPVLILQGLTDTQVSPEQADTLAVAFRKGGNKDVTLRTFPATNHLFVPDTSGKFTGYTSLKDPKVRPAVLGAIADWSARVLR